MRTLRLLVVLIILAVQGCTRSPPPNAPPPESSGTGHQNTYALKISKITLDNGLHVVGYDDDTTQNVTVLVGHRVGYWDEQPGQTGFTKLTEILLKNATTSNGSSWQSELAKLEPVENLAQTGIEWSWHGVTVPGGASERALWLEANRLIHLGDSIDEAALNQARASLKAEQAQESQHDTRLEQLIARYTYPAGHPKLRGMFGTEADVAAATPRKLREWIAEHYGAANSVVVIVGSSKHDSSKGIREYFGSLPMGPALPAPLEARPAQNTTLTRNLVITESMPDLVPPGQRSVYAVWNIPGYDTPAHSTIALAATMLADGPNSRLGREFNDGKLPGGNDVDWEISNTVLGSQLRIHMLMSDQVPLKQMQMAIYAALYNVAEHTENVDLDRAQVALQARMARAVASSSLLGTAQRMAEGELLRRDAGFYWSEAAPVTSVSLGDMRKYARQLYEGGSALFILESKSKPTAVMGAMPAIQPRNAPRLSEAVSTLPNGLQVRLVENERSPLIDVRLMMQFGNAGQPGALPSILVNTLIQGTQFRDGQMILTQLGESGAAMTTDCTASVATIRIVGLESGLERIVELLGDFVSPRKFDPQIVEHVRQDLIGEQFFNSKNPDFVATRDLSLLLYGRAHPYAGALTDFIPPERVESTPGPKVRELFEQHVRPDNMVLQVVGPVKSQRLEPVVRKYLGILQKPATPLSSSSYPPAQPDRARVIVDQVSDDTKTYVYGGTLIPAANHPRYLSALALFLLLDRANAKLSVIPAQGASLVILQSEASGDIETRLKELKRAVEALKRGEGAATENLARIKRVLRAKQIPQLMDLDQLSEAYARIVELNLPAQYPNEISKAIDALTPEDVRAAAKNLGEFSWVILGGKARVQ